MILVLKYFLFSVTKLCSVPFHLLSVKNLYPYDFVSLCIVNKHTIQYNTTLDNNIAIAG